MGQLSLESVDHTRSCQRSVGSGWLFLAKQRAGADKAQCEGCRREMRAQIEKVKAAGVDVTHIDTHMGVAGIPELIQHYLELARGYRVPLLVYRQMDESMAGWDSKRLTIPFGLA